MFDGVKTKLVIFFISALLVGICVLLYFADASFAWGTEKILSCIFINLWLFFITPALRDSFLKNRGNSYRQTVKSGIEFGASRIALPVIFAPFFGLKYYFCIKSNMWMQSY